MITVKEAVMAALEFVDDIFADEKLLDPRLEEVELSEDEEFWYVTLSFVRQPTKLVEALKGSHSREYKILTVRSETGMVQSMKIRQPI